MSDISILRSMSWDQALHCFATAYVAGQRARSLERKLRFLEFTGIAMPLLVGATAAAFGLQSKAVVALLAVASIVGIGQLLGSLWALISRWQDSFAAARESQVTNGRLFEQYRRLGRNPPAAIHDAEVQLDLLDSENNYQAAIDARMAITDEEKRMGMRAALRELQRGCASCKKVPSDMMATQCGVCGNFKSRRI